MEEKNSYLQSSKTNTIGKMYLKSKNNSSYCVAHTNRENGITLIALVVTIVVLLILAGITIQLVFSDGGIINQANKGKEQIEKGTFEERLNLVNAEAFMKRQKKEN